MTFTTDFRRTDEMLDNIFKLQLTQCIPLNLPNKQNLDIIFWLVIVMTLSVN